MRILTIPKEIPNLIEARSEELISFARELVRTPSENPPGDESRVAAIIVKKMKEIGFEDVEILAKKEKRSNVVGRLDGTKEERSLLYLGHIDTKPVGAKEGWLTGPYSGEILDGELYGRGSVDMKASVAAMVMACGAIKEAGVKLKGKLLVAATADEEAGGTFGLKYLIQDGKLSADAVVIGEPSGINSSFDRLHIAARGVLAFEFIVHGTQMHSSLTDIKRGINACTKMAKLISDMDHLKLTYNPHPLYPLGPTINPAVFIRGGVFYGICPGLCVAGNDIRIVPGMVLEQVKVDLNNFLEKQRRKDSDLKVEIRYADEYCDSGWLEPVETSPKELIVKSVLDASGEILGRPPLLGGFPGATDASYIPRKIPTIPAFGPGLLEMAHSVNERTPLKDIIAASKIYALSAMNYLGYQ